MKVFPFKLVKDTTKIARRKKTNQFKRINYEETRTISRDIVGEVQAKKEHRENALALGADEGRDKLRKAAGSCK